VLLFVQALQIVAVFVLSGVTMILIGPIYYAAIGVIVMLVCGILLWDAGRHDDDDAMRMRPSLALSILASSIVFGLVWPAVPPILGLSSRESRA